RPKFWPIGAVLKGRITAQLGDLKLDELSTEDLHRYWREAIEAKPEDGRALSTRTGAPTSCTWPRCSPMRARLAWSLTISTRSRASARRCGASRGPNAAAPRPRHR